MPPDLGKYLQDVRAACDTLTAFTTGKSIADYSNDALLRAGVERQFITIGEALMQAFRLDASLEQSITELRRIIGFRNVLVHAYGIINDATVWGVVEKDMPILKREVDSLLARFGPP